MLSLGIDIGGTRVKAALMAGQHCVACRASERYRDPSPQRLLAQVLESSAALALDVKGDVAAIGLCAPGVLDESRRRILYSANIPSLRDMELYEVAETAQGGFRPGTAGAPLTVVTDQIAAATDYALLRGIRGRLLSISIGTGVGAAVLDCDEAHRLGVALRVSGDSPGHLGQMDVSLEEDPPRGPDGGTGSLEAYLGAAVLGGREPSKLDVRDKPLRALVRAIRICHAIYRPDEVALLGGIGIRLAHVADDLRGRVNDGLSRVARPDWKLGFGEDDFHAARGAARLALDAANRGD